MYLVSLTFLISLLSFLFPAFVQADLVKINEFLAHPTSGNKEWVEFYNPGGINLSSYFLDDDVDFNSDTGSSDKKPLSAIPNPTATYANLEFTSYLNNAGDYVVLFDQNGIIIDQFQYTEDPGADVSIGRSPDGSGSFNQLSAATKGAPNTSHVTNPTPSSSPSPSYATPTTFISPVKSPTPSPKSPTSIPKTQSTAVLGKVAEATESASSTSTPTPAPSPSATPSSSPKPESISKTKIASYLAGSGLIIIGLSIGLYLWYHRSHK